MSKKAAPPKRPVGRPRKLTSAITENIMTRIAAGESVTSICRDKKLVTKRTFYKHLGYYADTEFVNRYNAALRARADVHAEDVLDIADDDSQDLLEGKDGTIRFNAVRLTRDTLRINTRKWHMGRMNPSRYGDVNQHQHLHQHGHQIEGEITVVPDARDLAKAILQVLAKAGEPPTIEASDAPSD